MRLLLHLEGDFMKKPPVAAALLVLLFTAGYAQQRREHGGRCFGGGYIPPRGPAPMHAPARAMPEHGQHRDMEGHPEAPHVHDFRQVLRPGRNVATDLFRTSDEAPCARVERELCRC